MSSLNLHPYTVCAKNMEIIEFPQSSISSTQKLLIYLQVLWVEVKFLGTANVQVTGPTCLFNLISLLSACSSPSSLSGLHGGYSWTHSWLFLDTLCRLPPYDLHPGSSLPWTALPADVPVLIPSPSLHLCPRAYSVKPIQTIQCKITTCPCPSPFNKPPPPCSILSFPAVATF